MRCMSVWVDGPLTLGVKHGAIVYLDEVVEARKDTTVLIHPLSDDRRFLPIEKKGQVIQAVKSSWQATVISGRLSLWAIY